MAASDANLYAFELLFKGLNDSKTPVSKSKIQAITEAAIKAQKYYKHVVMHIEGFIRKSSAKHKLPGIYVIDSILRISRRKGKERDVFSVRFAKNLGAIFASAAKCVEEDKFKVFRCFKLWAEGNFFPNEVIDPIVGKINAIESFQNVPGVHSGDGAGPDELDQQDAENNHNQSKSSPFRPTNVLLDEKPTPVVAAMKSSAESPKVTTRSPEKARFDKRLLDFDYSDEEDGGSGQRSGSGRRSKKKAPTEPPEEDFFVVGKDGKTEFAIDKIKFGLRQQTRASMPFSMEMPESPVPPVMEPLSEENNEMELSSPGPEDVIEAAAAAAEEEKPVVVKSCTIWVGHLPKGTTEGELKKFLEGFGSVSTLDLIPSRGCAYASYEKRRHAEAALRSRRDFYKKFGDKVKTSWGPGRGIKAGYKEWNWDADTGVCEIKPAQLPANCRTLAEGSELLAESVPERLKARFSDKPEVEELKITIGGGLSASDASTRDVHPSSWETTASVGFVPLETHINTWNALLQAQAAEVPPVTVAPPPPLSVTFDIPQPPSFPPFFTSPLLAGAAAPMGSTLSIPPTVAAPPQQQSGSAITTIVTGQTSWSDPATPKSSLFAKMKAAVASDENPDAFTNLLAENEPPPINPLFLKPPPPLGVLNSGPPSLPPFPGGSGGGGPFDPAIFAALLRGQVASFQNNNGNMRMPFNGPPPGFGPRGALPSGGGGGGLPIFRLPMSGGPRGGGGGGFQGMDLNQQDGLRFPGGIFGGGGGDKDGGPNRFTGPDIRLPLLGGFPGGPSRPPFGPNDPRLPMWNGNGNGPPRDGGMNEFDGRGGRRNNNFDDDRRTNFSSGGNGDRDRQEFSGTRGGNFEHRPPKFHNSNNSDNRRNFSDRNGGSGGGGGGGGSGNNFSNERRFDGGQDFPRRPFQQRAPR
ncbi:putative Protein SCAF8 [Hypsibius exemplaris]|uniref:Splicing factor, arginine/serine-rich 15 n=1 Tax=Hypsibius exemplaris TaxID=2072580 RepID=A0A1W0WY11_HYPEX|nr:putative Protein SCAF8 [Hypsibius exemplaris]